MKIRLMLKCEETEETGDGSLSPSDKPGVIEKRLQELQQRYGLDFAGHMDDILHGRVLYRTIEYMRKHYSDQHRTRGNDDDQV